MSTSAWERAVAQGQLAEVMPAHFGCDSRSVDDGFIRAGALAKVFVGSRSQAFIGISHGGDDGIVLEPLVGRPVNQVCHRQMGQIDVAM